MVNRKAVIFCRPVTKRKLWSPASKSDEPHLHTVTLYLATEREHNFLCWAPSTLQRFLIYHASLLLCLCQPFQILWSFRASETETFGNTQFKSSVKKKKKRSYKRLHLYRAEKGIPAGRRRGACVVMVYNCQRLYISLQWARIDVSISPIRQQAVQIHAAINVARGTKPSEYYNSP